MGPAEVWDHDIGAPTEQKDNAGVVDKETAAKNFQNRDIGQEDGPLD